VFVYSVEQRISSAHEIEQTLMLLVFTTLFLLNTFQSLLGFSNGEFRTFSIFAVFSICGLILSLIGIAISFDRFGHNGFYTEDLFDFIHANIDCIVFIAVVTYTFFIREALDKIKGHNRSNVWITVAIVSFRIIAANVGVVISFAVNQR
jgi:uncharacterized membrane protein